jgi:hypothetical protein
MTLLSPETPVLPMWMLLLPPVTLPPAAHPIAMLLNGLVLLPRAPVPRAVFWVPTAALNAPAPMAVLPLKVVLLCSAF